jgi:hypothetical protein
MELEGSLLWSHKSATRSYSEQDKASPHSHTLLLDSLASKKRSPLQGVSYVTEADMFFQNIEQAAVSFCRSLRGFLEKYVTACVSHYLGQKDTLVEPR